MRTQIETWIKELDTELQMCLRVWGEVDAMKPSQRRRYDTMRELHEFLQALLDYPDAARYESFLNALRWCIDKLGQGEPTPEKERVRNALIWGRSIPMMWWSYRALQVKLQQALEAHDALDLLSQITNQTAYDLTSEQVSYAYGLLRARLGRYTIDPPAQEPELILEG